MKHKVEEIKKNNSGAVVTTKDKDGNKKDFECNVVLISVGRKPNTSKFKSRKSWYRIR